MVKELLLKLNQLIIETYQNKYSMKEQFVTYEIALKLKELGFDEECLSFWFKKEHKLSIEITYGGLIRMCEINKNSQYDNISNYISAPIWQQAIDWLLEKHNLLVQQGYCKFALITPYDWIGKLTREQAILKALELINK